MFRSPFRSKETSFSLHTPVRSHEVDVKLQNNKTKLFSKDLFAEIVPEVEMKYHDVNDWNNVVKPKTPNEVVDIPSRNEDISSLANLISPEPTPIKPVAHISENINLMSPTSTSAPSKTSIDKKLRNIFLETSPFGKLKSFMKSSNNAPSVKEARNQSLFKSSLISSIVKL